MFLLYTQLLYLVTNCIFQLSDGCIHHALISVGRYRQLEKTVMEISLSSDYIHAQNLKQTL